MAFLEDKNKVKTSFYGTDHKLVTRQQFHELATPFIDLEKEVVKMVLSFAPFSILDAGCGNGSLLIRMRKEFGFPGKLLGLDISSGVMRWGLQHADESDITLTEGDIERMPYLDESFDAIIVKHVLQHVHDMPRTIAELRRCLKSKGALFIVANSEANKPLMSDIIVKVQKKFGYRMQRWADNASTETIVPLLSAFQDVQITHLTSQIRLTSPDPFVKYYETYHDAFVKMPSEIQWVGIKEFVTQELQAMIKKHGSVVEQNHFAIMVAKK